MKGQNKGLKVDNLQVSFRGHQAVKGISFEIPPGARVGLIGESGSGKSVTALSLIHQRGKQGKRKEVIKMLQRVGLPDPEQSANAFPHQLSGGQRQRVMMAMALINAPQLLICDEPTTALDVTVQAKVLRLLDKELSGSAAACLFISHDLAVVNQICDYLLVMYQGQIVERGPLRQLLERPKHPYTRGLLATADIAAVKPGERLPILSDFFRGSDE